MNSIRVDALAGGEVVGRGGDGVIGVREIFSNGDCDSAQRQRMGSADATYGRRTFP